MGLVGFMLMSNNSKAKKEAEAATAAQQEAIYIWRIDYLDIDYIKIDLEKQGMSEAWEKHEDQYFYFAEADGSIVDIDRWGGGVQLLLSGPLAKREVVETDDPEILAVYGLAEPAMRITVKTGSGEAVNIEVGDRTPDGTGNYIKLKESKKGLYRGLYMERRIGRPGA